MCCTICVLNRERTLNVELQFELFEFCTSVFVFYYQINILNMSFGRPFDERTIITPDVAYGCGTWPSRLMDDQRLKFL
jgi:hypothetical protein